MLTWIAVVLVWHFVAVHSNAGPLFPPPATVLKAFILWLRSGDLVQDVAASCGRVTLGWLIGTGVGLLVGLITGVWSVGDRTIGSVLNTLRALPPVALVPLAILWFGISEVSKIAIVGWGAFFPVWLNTHIGIRDIDRTVVWAARSLGARGSSLLFRVILPAALPQVVAGVRLAIGIAYVCVFVAELAGASRGLGFRIATAHLTFRADLMLAGLAVLGFFGYASDRVFVLGTGYLMPWTRSSVAGNG
ncbi:MAG: ABC transporter permease [Acidobacteria bacterium]|nr:ABC transporter permease [Acidobacteriota bacterium]MBV9477380.1 ABC transporter permease [Acidobacteriota bacterium]